MKHGLIYSILLPSVICLVNTTSIAQSPRLQLLEYFDNTSIPPFGAVANANVDSLMINYKNKITCIKYHVAWGSQTGTDPMNLHNPGQALTRVQYYNVTTDPHAKQDGAVPSDSTFAGQPSTFNSGFIMDRDTVTSPFTIAVSHSFNTAKDTIFTNTVIKKTGNVTAPGPLVAHVVILEKLVYFSTAPGVSGDKIFHNVMKYMLPGDTGTALPAMNIGDSLGLNYKWKLANVYDSNQLCAVSFVQNKDSSYREVFQAGQSFPIPVMLDAGITSIQLSSSLACDSIDQYVILKNIGTDTLVSCLINYTIDAGAPVALPLWTGSLATGASDTVQIHLTGQTGGNHTLKVISSAPNGGTDMGPWTDTVVTNYSIVSPPVFTPLLEGFQGAFSPASWLIQNPNNDLTWKQATVGGFGYSNRSAKLDFYDIAAGLHDHFLPPVLDLSADTGSIYCHFSLAHAGFAKPANDPFDYFDTLVISVSTNCGATWTTLYMKSDTAISTAPLNANAFIPNATQWKHQMINLTSYIGQSDVQLRFTGRSGYGNNIYIDDINISHATVGIQEDPAFQQIRVFPNPSSGTVFLSVQIPGVQSFGLVVTNIVGETIRTIEHDNQTGGLITLDLSDQPSGLYFVRLTSEAGGATRKIVLSK